MLPGEKLKFVESSIRNNLYSFDLLFCFFVSTLNSLRPDSLLRPFPSHYLSDHGVDTEKNFDQLKSDVSSVTCFEDISRENYESKETIVNLFHWLLVSRRFTLLKCDKEEFRKIEDEVGSCYKKYLTPSYVFQVDYGKEADGRFETLRAGRKLLYAYHGSRLENFYSILHNGLCGHFNKTALFGEGTYLSSELSLCLDYSPYGCTWHGSVLGRKLSCVAVCEIIDCDSVKCQVKESQVKGDGSGQGEEIIRRSKSRSRIEGTLGGNIPDKYYVVTNDDVIRIKYILAYVSRDKHSKSALAPWYARHTFMLVLLAYLLLLLCIGLCRSPSFLHLLNHLFYRQ